MTDEDRDRWDEQHAAVGAPGLAQIGPPRHFADQVDVFPAGGTALEVACGNGSASVWLAQQGLDVIGVDVSAVAVERARALAQEAGVADRCRFEVVDLDRGLPDGPLVDVLVCHMFRDTSLYAPMVARLAPGGLLAMAVQSEADVGPGRYKAPRSELTEAFASLAPVDAGEGSGFAWFLGRKTG